MPARHRILGVALVTVAAVLGACGGPSTSATSGSDLATAPPPGTSTATSPTVVPGSPTPRPELLFAVVESHVPAAQGGQPGNVDDTVAVVALDGYARSKATFSPRIPPTIGNASAVLQPDARVAAGRVFYIDGQGVVRSLGSTRGSSPAMVTTLPAPSPQGYTSFAISPDGTGVVAAIDSISAYVPPADPGQGPVGTGADQLRVVVVTAGVGAPPRTLRTIDHPAVPMAVGGWDASAPIGLLDPPLGTQALLPTGWFAHAARLDAAANPTTSLGGADCRAVEESADGRVVLCAVDSSAQAPSGLAVRPIRTGSGAAWTVALPAGTVLGLDAHVSPDGSTVAAAVGPSAPGTPGVNGAAVVAMRRGGTPVTLLSGRTYRPEGWLDDDTVIGALITNDQTLAQHLALLHVSRPGTVDDLGFNGAFVGVVQQAG